MEQKDIKNRGQRRKVLRIILVVVCLGGIISSFYLLASGRMDQTVSVALFLLIAVILMFGLTLLGKQGK